MLLGARGRRALAGLFHLEKERGRAAQPRTRVRVRRINRAARRALAPYDMVGEVIREQRRRGTLAMGWARGKKAPVVARRVEAALRARMGRPGREAE